MPSDQAQRRLAAILAADVVGYSRLMGRDEVGTLTRLKAHRRALIDPAIDAHRGRIVKTTGDGMLVEFASAVDAVRCAIALQRGMAERNLDVPAGQRIDFRVGVNVGDIIVEDDDIYGDGVNIAARLESIAEPGGITLSEDAWRQVRDRLEEKFADLGEKALKNIERPMRVYALAASSVISPLPPGGGGAPPPHPASPPPGAERSASSRQGAERSAAGGQGAERRAAGGQDAAGAPPRFSIVVLPFANLSSDAEQEYFADGLSEDLTTELSRVRGAFVIARNTAFTYKGKSVDVKQIGRDLGVRYALEGSVRKAGHRVRVNAQLIDTESGAHLWADRFDREIVDLFDLQDAVTIELADVLGVELVEAESRRGRRSANLDAIDLEMRGRAAKNRGLTRENFAEALVFFEQALRLDPDNVPALTGAADALTMGILTRWTTSRSEDLARAEALATRAVAVDPRDPWSRFAMAIVRRLQYRFSEVMAELDAAIRLNPNMAIAHREIGFIKIMLGQAREALPHIELSIRLSPRDQRLVIGYIGMGFARLLLGEDDAAIEALEKARSLNAQTAFLYHFLAAAYALKGRLDEARATLGEFLKYNPSVRTLADLRAEPSSTNPTYLAQRERMFEGLRRAGLPEA